MTFASGVASVSAWLRRKALARIELEMLVCGLESEALGLLRGLDNKTSDIVLRRIITLNGRRVSLLRWQARLQNHEQPQL